MSEHELALPPILSKIRGQHAIVAILVIWAINVAYNIFFHPLRRVPGPFLAKVSVQWLTWRFAQGKWHEEICELHHRYGPVVRIAPNEVSFVDKEAVMKIYGHSTGTKKTSWYDTWRTLGTAPGFFQTTNPKTHAFLRKRVASAYSMSSILTFEPQIQKVADKTWGRFREMASEGRAFDMQVWINYFTFDVVGQLGLGTPIGFIDKGGDVDNILHSVHDSFFISSTFGYVPGQSWWFSNSLFRFIIKLLPENLLQGGVIFEEWLKKVVLDRMAERDSTNAKARPRDMLDHFVAIKDPDGSPAPAEGVFAEGGNLFGAGADTVASSLCSVMEKLLKHPEDLARVRAEVDQAYSHLKLKSAGDMTYTEAEKLPFLKACIKEATRLNPSIPWQLPREAPAEGITIGDYYLPNSIVLSMSPIAHNCSKEIFGSDAEAWRPQRWIVGEGNPRERIQEMDRYNALFGFGTRVCIGRHLAIVEMYKFVAQFVRQFDCELLVGDEGLRRETHWFSMLKGMKTKLREREIEV